MATAQLQDCLSLLGRACAVLAGQGAARTILGRCLEMVCQETGAICGVVAAQETVSGQPQVAACWPAGKDAVASCDAWFRDACGADLETADPAKFGGRAALFLPLICHGERIGSLGILFGAPDDVPEPLLAVLSAIAAQIALAVSEDRQAALLDRQERESALLAEASSFQALAGPVDEILTIGLERLARALGAVFSVLWLAAPDSGDLRLHALFVSGDGGPTTDEISREVARAGAQSASIRAYRTRTPVVIEDAQATEFPIVRRYADRLGTRSAAFLPLVSKGEILGTLGMGFSHKVDFAREQRVLAVFADQVAALVHEAGQRVELARERAFLELLVKTAPLVIAYLDRDLVFRWVNPAALAMSPAPGETFVGKRLFDVFPLVDQPNPRFDAALQEGRTVFVKGNPLSTQARGRQITTYWDMAICPIAGSGGAVEGVMVICQDATERVESEQQQAQRIADLEELDRLKQNFLNVASHEFRTPLSSIIGYAEFLEDEVGGPLTAGQQEFVRQIQGSAGRLRHIVDDILDYARLESGSFRLSRREADVGEVVKSAVSSLRPQAKESGIRLQLRVSSRILAAEIDPQRIEQVVLNLVGNAVKFTPAGGRVEVSVKRQDDQILVEVCDTGIGIAQEHLARLWDKFYQVDPSNTREQGGAGLGLAIARALVEAHGGRIWVISRHGAGSTFAFALPGGGCDPAPACSTGKP